MERSKRTSSARATRGFSPAAMVTRCKALVPASATFSWASTTATSRSSARSASPTGSHERGDATQLAILFNNPHYEEISLSQWLASNPASLLADNFGVTSEVIDRLPRAALGIAK